MRTELSRHAILPIISQAYFTTSDAKRLFRGDPAWEGRQGGYLCIAEDITGYPYAVVLIGSVPDEKHAKYFSLCQEKSTRLASHPDHVSSWQSRDPDGNKWGGAIKVNHLIFSFSGGPELGDEALMLAVAKGYYAKSVEIAPMVELAKIAALSKNPYWHAKRGELIYTA